LTVLDLTQNKIADPKSLNDLTKGAIDQKKFKILGLKGNLFAPNLLYSKKYSLE
jgi:hypothetical protein